MENLKRYISISKCQLQNPTWTYKKGLQLHNNAPFRSSRRHLDSQWGKVAYLQCKFYKFGPLVLGTTCNLMPHVCLFLITRPLGHQKTKVIIQKLGCKKIFHIKPFGQTLTAKYKGLTMKVKKYTRDQYIVIFFENFTDYSYLTRN